jgi:hypothetical protein
MKNQKFRRLSLVGLSLVAIGFLLSACQPAGYGTGAIKGDGTDTPDTLPGDDTDPEAAYGLSALGVKNYLQVYESMWAVTELEQITGLARTDGAFNNIRNLYTNSKASLPASNDIQSFTASHRLAISNLAWEFCDRALENQTVRANWFSGTTFAELNNNQNHKPSQVLNTPALRDLLASKVLEQIWGEEIVETQGRLDAIDELSDLTANLLTGATEDAQASRTIIKGVCTAALASAAVSLF